MEAQMVDREPHRSVLLIRRIDTRVPANLLSQTSATGSTLGKLADLRAQRRVYARVKLGERYHRTRYLVIIKFLFKRPLQEKVMNAWWNQGWQL